MRLSKTDISIWLISGFAITGLTLLFMGVMNAPASRYRPADNPNAQVINFDDLEESIDQPKQDPTLVILNADSIK
jgi:hypothetical protein